MFVLGYGINMDIDNIPFAVYDQDRSPESRDYIQNIAGSRYFVRHPDILNDKEMDQRMRSSELAWLWRFHPILAKNYDVGEHPL